jgi:hypothetical protein
VALAAKAGFERLQEQEKVSALTEVALRNMGKAAAVTKKQVEDNAASLGLLTGRNKDSIQAAENMALSFKSVAGNANLFKRVTQDALDSSARTGKDMTLVTRALGRAMDDPVKGAGMLARAGIFLTQSQKDTVKAMVEHNQTAKAQALILGVVESKSKGAAAALGNTTTGQVNRLKEALGQMEEQVARAVLPALMALAPPVMAALRGLAPVIGRVAEQLGGLVKSLVDNPAVQQFAATVRDDLVAAFTALIGALQAVLPAVVAIAAPLAGMAGAILSNKVAMFALVGAASAFMALNFAQKVQESATALKLLSAAKVTGSIFAGFGTAIGSAIRDIGNFSSVANAMGGKSMVVSNAVGRLGFAFSAGAAPIRALIASISTGQWWAAAAVGVAALTGAVIALATGAFSGKSAEDALADGFKRIHDTAVIATSALDGFAGAVLGIEQAQNTERSGLQQLRDSLARYNQMVLEHGRNSAQARAALVDLRNANTNYRQSVTQVGPAISNASAKLGDMQKTTRDVSSAVADQVGLLRQQATMAKWAADAHKDNADLQKQSAQATARLNTALANNKDLSNYRAKLHDVGAELAGSFDPSIRKAGQQILALSRLSPSKLFEAMQAPMSMLGQTDPAKNVPPAITKLQNLKSTIDSIPTDKVFTLHIRQDGTASIPGRAMGGYVYASGGVVSGPSGTDKVPAMLTSGEVVLNKKQQALVNGGMGINAALAQTGGVTGGGHFQTGGTADSAWLQATIAPFVSTYKTELRTASAQFKQDMHNAKSQGDKNAAAKTRNQSNASAFGSLTQAIQGFISQARQAFVSAISTDTGSLSGGNTGGGLVRALGGASHVGGAGGFQDIFKQYSASAILNLSPLTKLQRGFDAQMKSLDDDLQTKLKGIDNTLQTNLKSVDDVMAGKPLPNLAGFTDDVKAQFASLQDATNRVNLASALSPAEKALADFDKAATASDLGNAVSDAQAKLQEAQQYGSAADIATAQKALDDAKRAQQRQDLQDAANDAQAQRQAALAQAQTDQQAAADALRTAMQTNADAEKTAAQQHADDLKAIAQDQYDAMKMAATGAADEVLIHTKGHRKNLKGVLQGIAGDFAEYGGTAGDNFKRELNQSLDTLGSGLAKQLANEIKPYLKMNSPAEKGPLSEIDTWFNGFVPALMSGVDTSAAIGTADDIAMALAPGGSITGGGAGGRGATVINVTVNGNELSARDFARKLKPELDRIISFSAV